MSGGVFHRIAIVPLLALVVILSGIAIALETVARRTVAQDQVAAAASYLCGQGDERINSLCAPESSKFTYSCVYPSRKQTQPNKGALCMRGARCRSTVGGHDFDGHCERALCCKLDTVDGKRPDGLPTFDKPVFNETTGTWENGMPQRIDTAPLVPGFPGLLGPGSIMNDQGQVLKPNLSPEPNYSMQQLIPPRFLDEAFGSTWREPLPVSSRSLQDTAPGDISSGFQAQATQNAPSYDEYSKLPPELLPATVNPNSENDPYSKLPLEMRQEMSNPNNGYGFYSPTLPSYDGRSIMEGASYLEPNGSGMVTQSSVPRLGEIPGVYGPVSNSAPDTFFNSSPIANQIGPTNAQSQGFFSSTENAVNTAWSSLKRLFGF